MTAGPSAPLRVALLQHAGGDGSTVRELAAALREAGHEPSVVTAHVLRVPEALLRRRGFDGPLTHLPLAVRALGDGGYHVAHAFSPPDAAAALLWRRLGGGPVVFTAVEPLGRDRVASRRLRLRLITDAVERSDAVTATSEESRAALWRWLAVEAPVIAPADAAAHEALYRGLLARRGDPSAG